MAELLILRDDMPRSLHACMREAYDIMQLLARPHATEALRRAGALWSELHFGRIDVIFNRGLHEYLTEFLTQTDALGQEINRSYFTLG